MGTERATEGGLQEPSGSLFTATVVLSQHRGSGRTGGSEVAVPTPAACSRVSEAGCQVAASTPPCPLCRRLPRCCRSGGACFALLITPADQ